MDAFVRNIGRALFLTCLSAGVVACGDDSGGEGGGTGGDGGGPLESGRAEIIIDAAGMVHVYGENDRDVMFASGYQMASDRLLQMDLVRRRALGRRAEIQGLDRRDDDRLMRVFNFGGLAVDDLAYHEENAPEELALVQAWVDGVNKRLGEVREGTVPRPYGLGPNGYDYVPEDWTALDVFATAKLFMFGNSNTLEYEILGTTLATLNPEDFEKVQIVRPAYDAVILPPEDRPTVNRSGTAPRDPTRLRYDVDPAHTAAANEALKDPKVRDGLYRLAKFLRSQRVEGSNNWAVAGRHTDNGRPIIANDPHQPIESPSVLYAVHLDSKSRGNGSINAGGFSFAGTPGMQLGHNDKVHWAATTAFADVMDLWTVENTGNSILLGGMEVPLTERTETIKVAGNPDDILVIQEAGEYGVLAPEFLYESFGIPKAVITGANNFDFLINWAGFQPTTEVIAFFEYARSQSVADYEAATRMMLVGGFNWMVADANDISYTPHTLIPDRGDPSSRQMPYLAQDGTDPNTLWTGDYLTEAQLPASRATETGWVMSANNDPYGFTLDGNVHDDPFYYGAFFAPGYRAGRLDQRMAEIVGGGNVTVEQMQQLQLDAHMGLADTMLPHLETAYAAVTSGSDAELAAEFGDDARLGELVTLMQGWDRQMTRDSPGALAFHVWSHLLARDVTADEFGLAFGAVFAVQPGYALKVMSFAYNDVLPDSEDIVGSAGRDRLAIEALVATADWLESNFGSVDGSAYTWGDRHGTRLANRLEGVDQGWVPSRGGDHTVDPAGSEFFDGGGQTTIADRWESSDGPVFRFVTTFDEDGTPKATFNWLTGNSEDPDSPFFSNVLSNWLEGVYVPMPFTLEEVEAAESSRVTVETE